MPRAGLATLAAWAALCALGPLGEPASAIMPCHSSASFDVPSLLQSTGRQTAGARRAAPSRGTRPAPRGAVLARDIERWWCVGFQGVPVAAGEPHPKYRVWTFADLFGSVNSGVACAIRPGVPAPQSRHEAWSGVFTRLPTKFGPALPMGHAAPYRRVLRKPSYS